MGRVRFTENQQFVLRALTDGGKLKRIGGIDVYPWVLWESHVTSSNLPCRIHIQTVESLIKRGFLQRQGKEAYLTNHGYGAA